MKHRTLRCAAETLVLLLIAAMAESTMARVRLAPSTVLTSMSLTACSWLDLVVLATMKPPPVANPWSSVALNDLDESSVSWPVMT